MIDKTSWTSVEIQEEILQLMADEIQRLIVLEVQTRKYFGLIADETADITSRAAECLFENRR